MRGSSMLLLIAIAATVPLLESLTRSESPKLPSTHSLPQSCSCPHLHNEDINPIVWISPGYPNFLCPSSSCSQLIHFPEGKNSDIYLVKTLMKVNAKAWKGVSLRLLSHTFDMMLNENTFSELRTSFIIDDSSVQVMYKTSDKHHIGEEGQYKIEAEQILIRKGCDCNDLEEEKNGGLYDSTVNVSSRCELFFCDWTIETNQEGKLGELNIFVENVQPSDEVHVWNRELMKIYTYEELQHPRRLYLPDSSPYTHIFFWRKSKAEESTVQVSFETIKEKNYFECRNFYVGKMPLIITSPNYPAPYPSRHCHFTIHAEYGFVVSIHINDIDIGVIEDELIVYDGEPSKENLIRKLSGKDVNLYFTSTNSSLSLVFLTSGHNSHRGYHIIAKAVPNLKLLPQADVIPVENNTISDSYAASNDSTQWNTTESAISSKNETSPRNNSKTGYEYKSRGLIPNDHNMIYNIFTFFIFVLSVVLLAAAVYTICKCFKSKTSPPDEPTVRYTNGDNISIATMETIAED